MTVSSLPAGVADDLLAFSCAAVILVAGLVSLAVAAGRRTPGRRTLLYLGIFAVMYGVRIGLKTRSAYLLADSDTLLDFAGAYLTYTIPIPAFLLFHDLIGALREWLFRVAMVIQISYSIAAIVIDALLQRPEASMGPNGPIVIGVSLVVLPRIIWPSGVEPAELRPLRIGIAVFILFALHENLTGIGVIDSRLGLEPLGMFAFLAGVGVSIFRRVERTNGRLSEIEGELKVAQRIQSSILPRSAPPVDGLDIAALQVPAREVGGDFYDFVHLGNRSAGILVADVAGHGVPAALVASMVKIALASMRSSAGSPSALLTGMNEILRGQIGRGFVTASYLVIDLEARTIRAAKAGHPAPFLIDAEGAARPLESEGAVLGRFANATFEEIVVPLPSGGRVIIYSDGITEARAADGTPYGEDRLVATAAARGTDAATGAAAILDSVRAFASVGAAQTFDDDVTVVVARDATVA